MAGLRAFLHTSGARPSSVAEVRLLLNVRRQVPASPLHIYQDMDKVASSSGSANSKLSNDLSVFSFLCPQPIGDRRHPQRKRTASIFELVQVNPIDHI